MKAESNNPSFVGTFWIRSFLSKHIYISNSLFESALILRFYTHISSSAIQWGYRSRGCLSFFRLLLLIGKEFSKKLSTASKSSSSSTTQFSNTVGPQSRKKYDFIFLFSVCTLTLRFGSRLKLITKIALMFSRL